MRNIVGFVMAPALGLAAMLGPVLVSPPAKHYDAPLFPVVRDAVEGVGVPQLILLFAAGVALGVVSTSRAWLLGLAAIAALPIVTVLELIKDPASHNLFPLEFATYAFYGIVVMCGVLAIRRVRRPQLLSKNSPQGVPE